MALIPIVGGWNAGKRESRTASVFIFLAGGEGGEAGGFELEQVDKVRENSRLSKQKSLLTGQLLKQRNQ